MVFEADAGGLGVASVGLEVGAKVAAVLALELRLRLWDWWW